MTCSNTDSIGVIKNTQCLEDLVVVGERLTLAHEHDARRALTKVVGNMQYLVNDLLSGQ